MWKIPRLVILGLAITIAAALAYGSKRWQSATDEMHARLEAARLVSRPTTYSPSELIGLPAPVQRYFRAVLTEGQPMIAAVRVEHTGSFNMSESVEQWKPFSSTQRVVTQRPGFDWEARGALIGGVIVPTPWECRVSTYELRDGMRVPIEGEVAWVFPEGQKSYWRGRITSIVYAFAP
jgi:hypothetical protein